MPSLSLRDRVEKQFEMLRTKRDLESSIKINQEAVVSLLVDESMFDCFNINWRLLNRRMGTNG